MTNQVAYVTEMPDCDFCEQEGAKEEALFDARTKMGPWANMCRNHFYMYGVGLGTGVGQMLKLKELE